MLLLMAFTVPWATQAQQTLPFNEGFESMSSASDLTAAGWISYQSDNSSFLAIETTASNVMSGSSALNIDSWNASTSSDYVIVGLPLVNADINSLQITFSYKVNKGNVSIGYLTDASDASTFVSLQQFNASSSYTTKTVELSSAPSSAARIAIKYLNYYRCYIDDIEVKALPTCYPPTALNVVPDATTAAFSWTASTTAVESYEWLYTTAGETPDWTAANSTTETSVELNRLNPQTSYVAYVRSNCGGGDYSDGASMNFTTTCASVTTFPWSENFDALTEANTIPNCWDNSDGTTTSASYKWSYNTNSSGNGAAIGHTGTDKCLVFNSYNNSSNQTNFLKTPTLSLPAGRAMELTFSYKNPAGGDFSVFISTDNGATYTTALATGLTGASSWTESAPISLADYAGQNVVIVFKGTSNYGNGDAYIYLDEVRVALPPSCVKPAAPTFVSATTTTATLSWTAGADETAWQMVYSTDANFDPNDETLRPVDVNENPGTITGLTASTAYYACVRANCGENGYSDWSVAKCQFTTACEAITTYPWTENFDGLTVASEYTPTTRTLPVCWNFINTTTYSSYKFYPTASSYSSSSYANSGSNYLKLYSYYSSYSNYDPQPQYAILPEMSGLAGKQITLMARGYSNGNIIMIGTMTNPADATTFVQIAAQALTTSYQEFTFDIPSDATAQHVAIMIEAADATTTSRGAYIDDITIDVPPTCIKPNALAKNATTAHTATLSWTAGAEGQSAWQIVYSTEASFDPNDESLRPVDVTENPATIRDLSAATTYYAYVRANCGDGDFSAWCRTKVSFTTTNATAVPTGLACDASTITSSAATLNWHGVATNDLHQSFDLYYSTQNTLPDSIGSDSLVTDIREESYSFAGLDAEKTYYVWVRDNCGSDGYSNWSSSANFTTASACQTPDGLAASEVTANTASISWNTYGQRGFNLRYSTDGERWETVEHATTPYRLERLTEQTTYQVQVQAQCNDSVWSSVMSFTTACEAQQVPLSDNFDTYTGNATSTSAPTGYPNHTMPDCWDFLNMSTTTSTYPQAFLTSNTSYAVSGNCLFFKSSSTTPLYAVLPAVERNLSGMQLQLTYRNEGTGASNGTVSVGYMTDVSDVTTYVNVESFDQTTTLTEKLVKFNGDIPNGARAVICYTGGTSNNYYASVDNVVLCKQPTCFQPTAAAVDNVTTESATLTWTRDERNAEGETYTIKQVTSEGDVEVRGAEAISGSSFELTGLRDNTTYTYKIVTNCAADDETVDPVTVTFTTVANCPAPVFAAEGITDVTGHTAHVAWTGFEANDSYVVSYRTAAYFDGIVENFGASSIPTGWAQYSGLLNNVMGGTALTASTYGWSFANSNGVFDGHTYANIYGGSCNKWLVTPAVEVGNNYALNFDLALTAYRGTLAAPEATGTDDKFVVLVSTDNAATWTILRQWDNAGSEYVYNNINSTATGETVNINLADYVGQTVKIAFYVESTTSNADNNIHIDNIGIGVMVAAGEWQTVSTNETATTLTDLIPETLYEVKVKGLCTGAENESGDVLTFTTTVACPAPTALQITNVTNEGCDLAWTPDGTETQWIVKVGSSEPVTVDAASYQVTGLTGNTEYAVAVKAYCGSDDGSSLELTGSFRTECDAQAIPFVENFDGESVKTYVPDCWTLVPEPVSSSTTAWGKYNSSSYANSGSYSLRSNNAKSNVAILPDMDAEAISGLQVRFWHKAATTSAGTLQVGYLTSDADTSTFVMVSEFAASENNEGGWSTVKLNTVPDEAVRIAFRHVATGSGKWYVDDVNVEPLSNCEPVSNVAVADSSITATAASISWEDANNENATYSVKNGDVVLGTTEEAGAQSITLTGLTPNTTYNTLVVVSNCGESEHSGAMDVPSFRTLNNENAITAFDLMTTGVKRGDAVLDAMTYTVTVPVYYTTDFSRVSLNFTLSTYATMKVQNEAEEWVAVTPTTLRNYLTPVNGGATLAVKVVAEDGTEQPWTIVLEPEACTSPRNITFSDVERIRATVAWGMPNPEGSNQFQLVYNTEEMTAEALDAMPVATENVVTGTTTTLENLDRETTYHVYVRALCGDDGNSEWIHGTVTTKGLGLNNCDIEGIDVAVGSGTATNNSVPFAVYYHNSYTQQLFTAEDLEGTSGTIRSLKFNYFLTSTTSRNITVYLGNTDATSLASSWITPADMTEVFHTAEVTFSNAEDNWYTLELDEPFEYAGGNLVVAILMNDDVTGDAQYSSTSRFYATAISGKARYFQSDGQAPTISNGVATNSGTALSYRNNIKFSFCGMQDACPAVTEVAVSNITETGATLTWTASTGDYVSGYQVIKSTSEMTPEQLANYNGSYEYEGTALTSELTGLDAYTQYYIYVRANCNAHGHEDGNSGWVSVNFQTLSTCGVVTNLNAEITGKNTATATWEKTKEEQDNHFSYILSTIAVGIGSDTLEGMTPTESDIAELGVDLTGLDNNTTYYLYVRNDCASEGLSPWISTVFTTPEAMPAVLNLTATEISHSAIVATWERNEEQYADETAWQVAAVAHGETPAAWQVANAMHYTFIGLAPNTAYDLYVRPYDSETEAYGTEAVLENVTTNDLPAACEIVADGTTTNSYVPVYGYYVDNYTRSQFVYPAESLSTLANKQLTGMTFFAETASANWGVANFKVYVTETENATISAFADVENMTLVYDGSLGITGNQMSIAFDSNFSYSGGNLLVAIENDVKGSYVKSNWYGISSTGSSVQGNNSSSLSNATASQRNFLPKVQFCYERDENACFDLTNVTVSDVTAHSAHVSWMPGNTETSWQYALVGAETSLQDIVEGNAELTTVSNIVELDLTGLTADYDYYLYMRPVCGEDVYGNFIERKFQTLPTCGLPTLLAATEVTSTTATLNAEAHPTIGTAQNYTFRYWMEGDEENRTTVAPSAESSVELTGLTPNTTYYYDVMVSCGENDDSRWSEVMSFTTLCAAFAIPYYTDFEAGDATLNCWNTVDVAAGTKVQTSYPYHGSQSFKFAYNSNPPQYLISPELTGTEEGVQVEFSYRAGSSSWAESFQVGYSTTTADVASFTWGTEQLNLKNINYNRYYEIIPTANVKYVAIKYTANNQMGLYIDSLVIRDIEQFSVATSVSLDAEREDTPMGSITNTPETLENLYITTEVSLNAEPADCYQFVNWTEGEGDEMVVVSRTANYTFNIAANRNLKANFVRVAPLTDTMAMVVCDSYEWNGETYTTSGEYSYATTTVVAGCDSIATLKLLVNYSTASTAMLMACDSYEWNGETYTTTGVYTYDTINAAGCDSTATLNLTVNYSTASTTMLTVCDSYEWNGETYTTTGVYTYDTANAAGCDSTATLNLTVNYSNTGIETVTACDSYEWHGNTYTASNDSVTFTETNAAGCDSVVTLNLTLNYSSTGADTITACDSYEWINGTNYTVSNNEAQYTLTNAVGCDSVVTLNLTINYSNAALDIQTVCDSLIWHGTTYTESTNVPTFVCPNAVGCDSTTTLNLIVNYSNTGVETVTACDSYVWHDVTYTASNTTATFTEKNAANCDSVVTLNLTVNYSNTGIDVVTACDSYVWHDVTYTASNTTATFTEKNAAGCDSVVTLNLTIHYSNVVENSVTACDSYTWQDTTYRESTVAQAMLTNQYGCDSLVTLMLTIDDHSTGHVYETACNTYSWFEF